MSGLALGLILVSAGLHAAWNLLLKRRQLDASRLGLAILIWAVLLLPAWRFASPSTWPIWIWALVPLSAVSQAFYYRCLSQAYSTGPISVAYPIARATPVVAVNLLVWSVSGTGGTPLLAFLLVVAGCLLIPQERWRFRLPAPGQGRSVIWALAAAAGTIGYSLIDDRCVRGLPTGSLPDLLALACLGMGATGGLLMATAGHRPSEAIRAPVREELPRIALVGVLSGASYALILLAMPLVTHVGWIIAFRQLSIPLGVFAGILFLREPGPAPKWCGLAGIMVGLIWAMASR